jgi:L-fuconolactonase
MIEVPHLRRLLALRSTQLALALAFVWQLAGAPAVAFASAALGPEPILDAHVQFYQVSRPGGVPWPKPDNKILYRDVTPAEYKKLAKENGIIGAGVVEASPLFADNLKLLDSIKGDDFFTFVVAQLDVSSADFAKNLDTLAQEPRVVGIRAFNWGQKMTLDAKQIENLKALAARGMTLEVVTSKENSLPKIGKLAAEVPDLRIMVDHMAGAKGEQPEQPYLDDVRTLATHQNVSVKLSSFYEMYNVTGNLEQPWQAARTHGAYKEHFDWLLGVFGPERVVFGSNWPVCDMAGSVQNEISVLETYLEPEGKRVRNRIMFQNAQAFYRRVLPRHDEPKLAKKDKASDKASDKPDKPDKKDKKADKKAADKKAASDKRADRKLTADRTAAARNDRSGSSGRRRDARQIQR